MCIEIFIIMAVYDFIKTKLKSYSGYTFKISLNGIVLTNGQVIELLKSNKKELREVMKLTSDMALEVLMEHNTVERGAELYRKINSEINWTYKKDKR